MSKPSKADERRRGREAGKAWMDAARDPAEGERRLDEVSDCLLGHDQIVFWENCGRSMPSENFVTAFFGACRSAMKNRLCNCRRQSDEKKRVLLRLTSAICRVIEVGSKCMSQSEAMKSFKEAAEFFRRVSSQLSRF